NPFVEGMLKEFGARSIVTERRRIMIGDLSGAKRPINFLTNRGENAPPPVKSRRKMVSRLRKLERKVIIWNGLKEFFSSWFTALQLRFNPFNRYTDQLRPRMATR